MFKRIAKRRQKMLALRSSRQFDISVRIVSDESRCRAWTYLTFDRRKVDIDSVLERNGGSGRVRKRRKSFDRSGKEKKGGSLEFHCDVYIIGFKEVKIVCFYD